MICTITLTPTIDKIIRGKKYDELRFEPEAFSYACGGCGIKVSKYLKKAKIDSVATYIVSSKRAAFFKELLSKDAISSIALETNTITPTHSYYIDENEDVIVQKEAYQQISDAQLFMFASVLFGKMENSTTLLSYEDTQISVETMRHFYQEIAKNSELLVCDLHPKYYEACTSRRMDVLLIDKDTFNIYMNNDATPLSECIKIIHNELTPLSKIIVYAYAPNDFLIFYGGNVYRALSLIKLANKKIYKEAILAAILTCLETDAMFEDMCKQCIMSSIGSNLSDGLCVTSALTKEKLEKSIHIYSI